MEVGGNERHDQPNQSTLEFNKSYDSLSKSNLFSRLLIYLDSPTILIRSSLLEFGIDEGFLLILCNTED